MAEQRRHIIKRPRLARLLNESEARVLLLVAPAGYGKTTLAREWLSSANANAIAWYRTDGASGDVVALATGLADALTAATRASQHRLAARLSSGGPSPDADSLAALIAEPLGRARQDVLLVVDDYHRAASVDAERLVERLIDLTGIRVLITSRSRPSWATARRLLYGQIYELGREMLAMDQDEAARVLSHAGQQPLPGLVALAAGWPAVIGLAAASDSVNLPENFLADTLYEFFAEEVVQSLPQEVREALHVLAIAPAITPGVVRALLHRDATEILASAVAAGILTPEGGGNYYLHPLLREFLNRDTSEPNQDGGQEARLVANALASESAWDEAFEVARCFSLTDVVSGLFESAGAEMLQGGRTASLTKWIEEARHLGITSPQIDLVAAEVAFRAGDPRAAETLALRAADLSANPSTIQSALVRASRAATFDDRPAKGAQHASRARNLATDSSSMRAALYAQFLAEVSLENHHATEFLDDFEATGALTVDDLLRLGVARLFHAHRLGPVYPALEDTRSLLALVRECSDPFVISSYLSARARALFSAAEYADSWSAAGDALREARESHLDFAIPHILVTRAHAAIGLNRGRDFRRIMAELDVEARADTHIGANVALLHAQWQLVRQRYRAAVEVLREAPVPPDRGTHAELLAYLALSFALLKQPEETTAYARQASATSQSAEPQVVVALAEAILSLGDGSNLPENLSAVLGIVAATGLVDPLVVALRTCPPLGPPITSFARDDQRADSFRPIIEHWTRLTAKRLEALTAREREVLELVASGMSNREVASQLFVSAPTVKVHLRHIYDKLGVRNRTEASARAAGDAYAARSAAGDPDPT